MLYRILTENKNEDKLIDLIAQYFTGFTVYRVTGFWKGLAEPTLVIEIDEPEMKEVFIRRLCVEIRVLNGQESVLLQKIECKSAYI